MSWLALSTEDAVGDGDGLSIHWVCGGIGAERDALLASAKEHFERLEADKRLCLRSRALGTVQRAFL